MSASGKSSQRASSTFSPPASRRAKKGPAQPASLPPQKQGRRAARTAPRGSARGSRDHAAGSACAHSPHRAAPDMHSSCRCARPPATGRSGPVVPRGTSRPARHSGRAPRPPPAAGPRGSCRPRPRSRAAAVRRGSSRRREPADPPEDPRVVARSLPDLGPFPRRGGRACEQGRETGIGVGGHGPQLPAAEAASVAADALMAQQRTYPVPEPDRRHENRNEGKSTTRAPMLIVNCSINRLSGCRTLRIKLAAGRLKAARRLRVVSKRKHVNSPRN